MEHLGKSMRTEMDLKNVTISTVVPFQKSEHPAVIQPSALDISGVLDYHLPVIFFYKHETGVSDALKLAKVLKQSLSEVLVDYFPFAGRWVRTYDATLRELQCTDEGVPFIEAEVDEDMESVVNLENFSGAPLLGGYKLLGLDPTVEHQDVDFPLPSLFVQMTKFKCGGIALQTTWAHQTADGQGGFAFLTAWSQTALKQKQKTLISPTHDRFQFKPFLDSVGPTAILSRAGLDREQLTAKREDPGARFKLSIKTLHPMPWKTMHVKRDVIDLLKAQAAKDDMQLTTLDLITAHIWRCFSEPKPSVGEQTPAVAYFTVDCRKKFHSPVVPENYSGNGFMLATLPIIPAVDLSSNSHLFAANIVHETVRAFTSKSWRSGFDFPLSSSERELSKLSSIIFSSWFRFPLYEIEFGCGFGKPTFACSNILCRYRYPALVITFPPPPSLSQDTVATIVVLTAKENTGAAGLYSNPRFLSFVR